jgi:hypothetical protein
VIVLAVPGWLWLARRARTLADAPPLQGSGFSGTRR